MKGKRRRKVKEPDIFLKHTAFHEAGHILMCLKENRIVQYAVILEHGKRFNGVTSFEDTENLDENLRITVSGMIGVKVGLPDGPSWKSGAIEDISIAMQISDTYDKYENALDEVENYFREPDIEECLHKLADLLLEKRAVNYDDIFEVLK